MHVQTVDPASTPSRSVPLLPKTQDLQDRRLQSITNALIRLTLILIGLDFSLVQGVKIGLLMGIATAPLWIPSLARRQFATPILAFGLLSIPSGYLLSRSSSIDHIVNSTLRTQWFYLLLSGLVTIGVILWAREHLPLRQVILFYATGSLMHALMFTPRSWKFDLAIPVILVVLSIASRFRSTWLPVVLLIGLGLFSVFNEGRSLFGFCAITALLSIWQMRLSRKERWVSRWSPLLLIGVVTIAFYMVTSSLLTAGVFGETIQQRSEAQIEASGSLIIGGRPEWAVTIELMKLRPTGYGPGVVPSWPDLHAGQQGFHSINVVDSAYGYLEHFMLGSGFELHSVVADLWVSFGIVGGIVGVLMIFSLLKSLTFMLADSHASAPVVFACLLGIWYLLFGTIYANLLDVSSAIGFALLTKETVKTSGHVPPGRLLGTNSHNHVGKSVIR